MQTNTIVVETSSIQPVSISKPQRRPHIYELDLMRVVTAVSVITVHVAGNTSAFSANMLYLFPHYVILVLAHARAVFAFVTAFALVYVYFGKPFSITSFWKKRALGILLPYAFWSCFYVWTNQHPATLSSFIKTSIIDIVTGTASYQLYYILLTLQMYILLPLFLLFLQKVKNHPWITLSISFVLQTLMLYVDYHYLQPNGPQPLSPFWAKFVHYQNTYIIWYQFFFVMGGFAALYQQQLRDFLLRHGKLIVGAMVVVAVVTAAHFALQIFQFHESFDVASAYLQPLVSIYNAVMALFFFYIACLWARRRKPDGKPAAYPLWHTLSDATFGVYLIHAFFITLVLQVITPVLPATWPASLRSLLVWACVVVLSLGCSILLSKTPVLSRLVGRKQSWPAFLTHRSSVVSNASN